MKRPSWFDGSRAPSGQCSTCRVRRGKWPILRTRRPTFELLEERALLAVLHVNSPLDNVTAGDGLVTLREAIIAANSNTTTDLGQSGAFLTDSVNILPSVTGIISLVFSELIVTEPLIINGPGRDVLTIDAHQASRIFNKTGGGFFEITGLSLINGMTTGDGGAVLLGSTT